MCGIVGYSGCRPAAPLLLEGLQKLEYRGYDSAGVALVDDAGLTLCKCAGRLRVLSERMNGGAGYSQTVGIGHTRWATHGGPSDANAHPHFSENRRFAVVHNGIIENYAELRQELRQSGVAFASETDTEVIAHLLERCDTGDTVETVHRVTAHLRGSYALGILCAERPGEIVAVRHASPLIIGLTEDGNFIASDVPAVLSHTRRVIRPEDGDVVRVTADGVWIWDADGVPTDRPVQMVDWNAAAAEKDGYAHFMLKEIMEQPRALEATLSPRIGEDGEIRLDEVRFSDAELASLRRIMIVACGSAYHAGVVGKYFFERYAGIPVEVDLASEFRYRDPLVDEHSLVIIVSQSGETADTLAALREAKRRGARTLAVVNVVGSTIAGESDDVLYTHAGPEIAVATTKGYTTQVAMLYLIGLYMAHRLGKLSAEVYHRMTEELRTLPQLARQALSSEPPARAVEMLAAMEHAYFIGRNTDYAVALEASLKLKEISYIHSEAYAAGELKHGTISLIEDGTVVAALACCDRLLAKTVSNIKEVRARGARVVVLTTAAHAADFPEADVVMTTPDVPDWLCPVVEVIPMQLLAYRISVSRGCDVDQPRNLAKSVTVE